MTAATAVSAAAVSAVFRRRKFAFVRLLLAAVVAAVAAAASIRRQYGGTGRYNGNDEYVSFGRYYYGSSAGNPSSSTTTLAVSAPSARVIADYYGKNNADGGNNGSENRQQHQQQQQRQRRRPFLSRLGNLVRRPFFGLGRKRQLAAEQLRLQLQQPERIKSTVVSFDLSGEAVVTDYYDAVRATATATATATAAHDRDYDDGYYDDSALLARLRSSWRRGKEGMARQQQVLEEQEVADERRLDEETVLRSLTEPLVSEEVWESLTGQEFREHPDRIDGLAAVGESIARQEPEAAVVDDWIDWRAYGSHHGSIEDGDIHLWIGKSKRDGHCSKVPWIKSKSIVPIAPDELADLLLDSERVLTYNSLSIGRDDVAVLEEGAPGGRQTKIVKNRTKIPMGSKPLVSVTLMHARPVESEPGAWLVVSRAVGGKAFRTDDELHSSSRSDILLGVNLLQPVPGDPDSSYLTAITHAYSSAVPSMLAEQLAVKGAVKFVKDLRKMKHAAVSAS